MVNGSMSVDESHDIATQIEEALESEILCDAVVHIEPKEPSEKE